jgi:hypothetical protein
MTLTYSLTANDYVQAQLFMASKSDRIKKKRKKDWLLFSGMFCFAGIVYALTLPRPESYYFLAYYLFGEVILMFFVYPPYQRNYYENHYKKYVADVFKNRINEKTTATFTDDFIEGADVTGTSKLNLNGIAGIDETGSYYFLLLKTGPYIIIPKSQLHNSDDVHTLLTTLSKKLNISFISDLNWKWK